ncbi:hypothetical protein TIFTF001_053007 [Ficus carica]|uniref:Uncharacterized protein n=1 Tax=Ficus carica TaxID=3494 RepID=A0AA88JI36_FICCA|nr:hypothetical protein TIFTF001_053004 [Ficus carica]GMN73290.1 hypothetical protein TIFTF001_053005 [Ficus carica]GMN73294.1 hypothetical protein TIFTF001_053006 [Ficus carica]GMN73296.1 hypothetical protein TIFTF001_053007 [Ficus carica]
MGRQGVGPAMVSNHCRGGILGEDHHLVRSHGVRGRDDGEREPIAACGRSAAVPRWKLVMEIVRLQELASGDTRSRGDLDPTGFENGDGERDRGWGA